MTEATATSTTEAIATPTTGVEVSEALRPPGPTPVDNLAHWNALASPPRRYLKEIKGGPLKGMTDINPTWRMRAMTEVFGPVGFGWRYQIQKLWTEQHGTEEVLAFARVAVSYRRVADGPWSEPIVGVGGSKILVKDKNGVHPSDDAYKMAITDGLSVAFKALGVAAEIYLGEFDGKYSDNEPARPAEPMATGAQIAAIKECLVAAKIPAASRHAYVKELIGRDIDGPDDLTEAEAVKAIAKLKESR